MSDLNDQRISYHESRRGGFFKRMVRALTRWAWRDQVRQPINRMFERGLIDSRAYHEAHDYVNRIVNCTSPKA